LIFDQDKENYQADPFSGDSPDDAAPVSDTAPPGPDGEEEIPLTSSPENLGEPQADEYAETDFESDQSLSDSSSPDPFEQEMPLAAESQPDAFAESFFDEAQPPSGGSSAEPMEQEMPLAAEPQPDAFEETPFEAAHSPTEEAAPLNSTEQVNLTPTGTFAAASDMEVSQASEQSETEQAPAAVKKTNKKIIAVGGAKGGVGKSILSANLAVGLALLGQEVVLADLDLGGADVHLYTGVKTLAKTWNDFLDKKVDSIEDILTPTAFEGLSLIGGDSSRLGSANLPYAQKRKIMRHLKELQTDYLVVDLGGDTTYNGLDFFLLADQKIVVSGTEPASVLDSYTFVKVVFNRFLERFFTERKPLKSLAAKVRNGSLEASENYSLEFLLQEVGTRDPAASYELQKKIEEFSLSIVLNMTESSNDLRIAESMQKLAKQKCFVDIGILGTIPFDKVVRKAARGFTPIVVENPKCQASRNIHQMLAGIIYHREQEISRSELLQTTNRIRQEVKEQIDANSMTLDGLTVGQINSVFNSTPRLRQSFQKILNILSG